ncbi:MAG: hypothetical protein COV44_08700 [Deltaproteobacteria bacterium CG11_big_fil_rev_8_21_14_0_20_45_16]|nr:MAG: hypothetical protein COV44_08700 [Deltaproteobacteria bacterium CG11_big_fil_rev_8_21_14_0_20_45_16]
MFGQSNWKTDVTQRMDQMEQQILDLQRALADSKAQTMRLSQMFKNVSKKILLRLPVSIESLEKHLIYDLIFAEEIETWLQMAREGAILDLRSSDEFSKSHIPGAFNLPLEQLTNRLDKIARGAPVLLVCENGVKSVTASEHLAAKGFPFIYVLKGGMSHYQGATKALEEIAQSVEV